MACNQRGLTDASSEEHKVTTLKKNKRERERDGRNYSGKGTLVPTATFLSLDDPK